MDHTLKKMLQKRVYDLLSHKYGILMLLAGVFLLALSAFHFGQAWLEWSQEKYEAVFNSFSDNIAGKSFRDRLSVPLPIDVVYTWVNGTDPELIRQLELVKVSLDKKNNLSRKQEAIKREQHCTYTNCFCVGVLLYPPLENSIGLIDIHKSDDLYRNVTSLTNIKENKDWPANFTLLALENETKAKEILKLKAGGWMFQGTNYTLKLAYYTSEGSLPHGLVVPEMVMMTGFPSSYSDGDIQQAIAGRLNITEKASIMVKLYAEKGLALLQISQNSHYDLLIKSKNFTIEGKELRLSPVRLVWDLKFAVTDDVVAASRFEDNEELRYSLRSVEQFAPWVRHIYIVTNGQIPYWLNLDNPRLTIITHDEIFRNQSHLPTFSSPAIEANIHRIPGLSDKFLYLNDDVMFGSPVWPDDFFSHSTGQKLYLTWPVPNCNEGCPSTWIRDGYCDRACNSSECDWDGGDCVASKGHVQLGAGFHGDHSQILSDFISYCATGCANNWLADKYCDQACNNLDCGFDIGDCGTSNYNKLYNLNMQIGQSHYILPPGEMIGYFNLSELLGDTGKIKSAGYETVSGVRAAAVVNKFKVMTVILNKGLNATTLRFHLEYTKGENDTQKLNLTVLVDTTISKPKTDDVKVKNETPEAVVNIDDNLDYESFQNVYSQRGPVAVKMELAEVEQPLPEGIDVDILEVFKYASLSDVLRKELENLHRDNKEGELTALGLNIRMHELMKHFGDELNSLKPKFYELKQRFAEEEKQRKIDEERMASSNLTDKAADVDKQEEQSKFELNEKNLNNGEGNFNDPSLLHQGNLQQQIIQDFQQLKQQDYARFNDRQKRFAVPEKLPQYSVYQANIPGKEMSLEAPQIKPQDSLFQQNNLDIIKESKPLPRSDGSARSQSVRKTLQGHRLRNSVVNFKSGNEGEGHINHDDAARASDVRQQEKTLSDVKHLANDTRDMQAGPRRKLLVYLDLSNHMARLEEQQVRARSKMIEDRLEAEMSDEDFLKIVSVEGASEDLGGFPWEQKNGQDKQENSREKARKENEYIIEGWQGRQLLDTFGDSLRHVNRIYNKEFGITARKVPGHMPHMVDKNIMQELQDRFPKEWDDTSAHKIRSSTDMQYAFSYLYYLMGVTKEIAPEDVFTMMDTDHSGVLSDREIRTLAARMFELPLYLETLAGLEAMFVNCSQGFTDSTLLDLSEEQREVYYDKNMPIVTKNLFMQCDEVVKQVQKSFKPVSKYKTTIVDDADIAFKMIHTNVSHVVGQLDDIRKHPKKFICLNDNIEHKKDEARTVKAILQDFYESLVPIPSQFELPRDYRNRFLHMDELRDWRVYRDRLRLWTHVALAVLVILTIMSFLGEKIENLRRKWIHRKIRHRRLSSNSVSTTSVSSSNSSHSSPPHWQQDIVETV